MKEELFKEASAAVENGAIFKVDLPSRTLVVDGKTLIKGGKFEGELGLCRMSTKECLEELEQRYELYKHSVPSERSDKKRRLYFKALKEEDLTDEDMLYGSSREVCQLKLELALLVYILNGSLVWDEEKMGKWFWQSEKDKDFVILREWIDGE